MMRRFNKIMKKLKKGQAFSELSGIFVGLATIMIVSVVVFLVISQARNQIGSVEGIDVTTNCNASLACNATNTLANAGQDAVNFVPLVVIAAIGAVLLGLVALFRRRR